MVIAMQVCAVGLGVALLSPAISIARKGLRLGKDKRVHGTPKWVFAGFFLVAALAVAIGGILYVPELVGS